MPLKSPLYEIYHYKLNHDNWENFQHNGIRQKKKQTRGSTRAEMLKKLLCFSLA